MAHMYLTILIDGRFIADVRIPEQIFDLTIPSEEVEAAQTGACAANDFSRFIANVFVSIVYQFSLISLDTFVRAEEFTCGRP